MPRRIGGHSLSGKRERTLHERPTLWAKHWAGETPMVQVHSAINRLISFQLRLTSPTP